MQAIEAGRIGVAYEHVRGAGGERPAPELLGERLVREVTAPREVVPGPFGRVEADPVRRVPLERFPQGPVGDRETVAVLERPFDTDLEARSRAPAGRRRAAGEDPLHLFEQPLLDAGDLRLSQPPALALQDTPPERPVGDELGHHRGDLVHALLGEEHAGVTQGLGHGGRAVREDRHVPRESFQQRQTEAFVLAHGEIERGLIVETGEVLVRRALDPADAIAVRRRGDPLQKRADVRLLAASLTDERETGLRPERGESVERLDDVILLLVLGHAADEENERRGHRRSLLSRGRAQAAEGEGRGERLRLRVTELQELGRVVGRVRESALHAVPIDDQLASAPLGEAPHGRVPLEVTERGDVVVDEELPVRQRGHDARRIVADRVVDEQHGLRRAAVFP